MTVLRSLTPYALGCALSVLIAADARAEWPCAGNVRHRVARSAKGDKPIGIAAANERLVYGTFATAELNNDGRQDLVFASACIRGPADSVRFHRVYASCGPGADGGEDFVLIFEEEELCARAVKIETQAAQSKANGVLWQDLQLVRMTSGPGGRCEQATQPLKFDGAEYRAGARASKPCPKP
jgi:hypothetical protein